MPARQFSPWFSNAAVALAAVISTGTGCRLPQRAADDSPHAPRQPSARNGDAPEPGPLYAMADRPQEVRDALESAAPESRRAGASSVRYLDASAAIRADLLLGMLGDKDENVRGAVVRALGDGEFGAERGRIAPALFAAALNDPAASVRSRAVGALGKLGPATIELVLATLPIDERGATAVTARILRDLVRAEPVALAGLARVLESQEPVLREMAAWALWELGADATAAMEPLLRALGDESETVRFYASWALGRMGARAVPSLVEELVSRDARVRSGAAAALGGIGADAALAIGPLRRLLGDSDPAVRESVRRALARIEGAAARQA